MKDARENIFRLAEVEGAEDRFTAAWSYLLKREPELAQVVTDLLLDPLRSGPGNPWSESDFKKASRVLGVTNHPSEYDSALRPDFRIDCDGLHVLVEHKLEALLHERQLQSYLEMPHTVPTFIALVTPSIQPVPGDVLRHLRYLKPKEGSHFRWSDFYPAVKNHPGWLAEDFVHFMNHLGLSPFTLGGAEDIFDATRDVKDFREALKAAACEVFPEGASRFAVKATPTGRGCEIRNPRAELSLIYAEAERTPAWKSGAIGPALAVAVYEKNTTMPNLPEAVLKSPLVRIAVQRNHIAPTVQGEGTARLCYLAPLTELIQDTHADTALRIADVLRVVQDDLHVRYG